MLKINEKLFIKVCNESESMSKACLEMGMHFNTFKSWAKKLGCYNPNQSGKGLKKQIAPKIPLDEILKGNYPLFQTCKLRVRLIKSGLKEEKCEVCGITEWNGKPILFELDHINGIRHDHRLENLRIICPNCHCQTDTYRAKNIKKNTLSSYDI